MGTCLRWTLRFGMRRGFRGFGEGSAAAAQGCAVASRGTGQEEVLPPRRGCRVQVRWPRGWGGRGCPLGWVAGRTLVWPPGRVQVGVPFDPELLADDVAHG